MLSRTATGHCDAGHTSGLGATAAAARGERRSEVSARPLVRVPCRRLDLAAPARLRIDFALAGLGPATHETPAGPFEFLVDARTKSGQDEIYELLILRSGWIDDDTP